MANIFVKLLFFLIFPAIFIECSDKTKNQQKPHFFKYYSHFNDDDYVKYIEFRVNNETDSAEFAPLIRKTYKNRNYHPFWTKNGFQEKSADSLITIFDNARRHGISPDFFHKNEIENKISTLKEHKIPNNDSLYAFLFDLEKSLTQNYVKYAASLQFGCVDPKTVHGNKWYYEMLLPDSDFVENLLSNIEDFGNQLENLKIDNPDYLKLQQNLLALTDFLAANIDTLPKNYFSLIERDSLLLENFKNRLKINNIKIPESKAEILQNIDKYLSEICSSNGISCDDEKDAAMAILNHPEKNLKKICANLERLRWKTIHKKSDDSVYICVNIPEFYYYVFQNDTVALKNKICCGRTQNPEKNPARFKNGLAIPYKSETPLLFSYISSLTLNPEWNIPYDIIKNEYYPKLVKSNTACINREHIYIKDNRTGDYVVPDSINWSKVNRNNIPYRLHQTSGRYNALGQVKFVFSNSESVYLHDTNNKGAFKRQKRALSHGCVRVENPFDLAEWIYRVNNFDTNYIEQLHIISGNEPTTEKGEEFLEKRQEKEAEYYESLSDHQKLFYRALRPSSVSLKKRIPLFIEYYTCFVNENGTIQFRDDVYYKDDNIIKQIYPELLAE